MDALQEGVKSFGGSEHTIDRKKFALVIPVENLIADRAAQTDPDQVRGYVHCDRQNPRRGCAPRRGSKVVRSGVDAVIFDTI